MPAAVNAGASRVNDVNGLRAEGSIDVVAQQQVPVCIMHMLGAPKTMQKAPSYENVVDEVIHFLDAQISACEDKGVNREDIIIDPGIGFGKTLQHNLALLKNIDDFKQRLSCEVLIGVSRKSVIDMILKRDVNERLAGSIGLAVQSVINGAKIVRVHDVRETADAIRCIEAVQNN